jgi:hypothetical protein
VVGRARSESRGWDDHVRKTPPGRSDKLAALERGRVSAPAERRGHHGRALARLESFLPYEATRPTVIPDGERKAELARAGLTPLASLGLLPPVGQEGVSVKKEEIVMSKRDLVVAKKRIRRGRMKRPPEEKDLPKLEREATKEMRRSDADLGVG